jgi:AbrB family looped-hinge helix DNA binding protein
MQEGFAMATATITSKGQITIPKRVRTSLGVGTGDRVEFVEIKQGVFQIVAATQDVKCLKGIVPKPKRPVTVADMSKAIAEMGGSN